MSHGQYDLFRWNGIQPVVTGVDAAFQPPYGWPYLQHSWQEFTLYTACTDLSDGPGIFLRCCRQYP